MLGTDLERQDAKSKASGIIRYTADTVAGRCLHARLLTSPEAHAKISSINTAAAMTVPGIRVILTGKDCTVLIGPQIQDMPLLAQGMVRYCGEPVALVVADEDWQALMAVKQIHVNYEPLPVVNSPLQALDPNAALIHPDLGNYKHTAGGIYCQAGTNIVNHARIQKGDMAVGWQKSEITVAGHFVLPQAAHSYMETRCATGEIMGDGTIVIHSSTQAPHATRELMAEAFGMTEGRIEIISSYVGGGYGGKVTAHPEMLVYLATKAVGGQKVSLIFTREQCFLSVGCKLGADCDLKVGATMQGKIMALEALYRLDTGAYADTGPRMTIAIACDSGGSYSIDHINCDAFCVYTNHIYATSFRGFGHGISTFCIERMIDKLARTLQLDAMQVRRINLAKPGDTTATQVMINRSNYGNPDECLTRVEEMIKWKEGQCLPVGENKVRAKGLACFAKTSSSPTDASSGAIITFCSDGSANLHCGGVECGQGFYTVMRQILAEKLKMNPDRVFIEDKVNTRTAPDHWKTVGSMSTFMAGNAVLRAAEDVIAQLKKIASVVLRSHEFELEVGDERVYLIDDPSIFVAVKDLVGGIQFNNGNAFGDQIIGRGSYVMSHLSKLDKETGRGRNGPYWTTGAQAVEIEYDTKECTFRLLHAVTAVDAGKVLNTGLARGQMIGAMNMGLSIASREAFVYNDRAQMQNSSLRTYKIIHFAENPVYDVEFVETPNLSGPNGARGLGEHGLIGMAPALANALAAATGKEIDELPVNFETLWHLAGEEARI